MLKKKADVSLFLNTINLLPGVTNGLHLAGIHLKS